MVVHSSIIDYSPLPSFGNILDPSVIVNLKVIPKNLNLSSESIIKVDVIQLTSSQTVVVIIVMQLS